VAKPGFPAFPISRLPDLLTPIPRFLAFPDGFAALRATVNNVAQKSPNILSVNIFHHNSYPKFTLPSSNINAIATVLLST
jgi:hypothetical protein